MLNDSDIPVSPVHIIRLEAFTEALNYGQGVTEYQSNGKASEYIKTLLDWIYVVAEFMNRKQTLIKLGAETGRTSR